MQSEFWNKFNDWMDRARRLLLAALLLAGVVFLACGTVVECHLDQAIIMGSYDAHNTLVSFAAAGTTAVGSLGQLQTDVHGLTSELTADSKAIATDIHRDVVVAGVTASETQKVMALIQKEAPAFLAQAHRGMDSLDALLADADGQVPLAGSLLASSRKFVDDSDAIVTGPTFTDFLLSVKDTGANVSQTTADIHAWTHQQLFPAKCVGKWCPLIKTYKIIRGVSGVAEPAYYTKGVLKP